MPVTALADAATSILLAALEAELSQRGVAVVVLQDGLTAREGETCPMELRRNLQRLGRLPPVNP